MNTRTRRIVIAGGIVIVLRGGRIAGKWPAFPQ